MKFKAADFNDEEIRDSLCLDAFDPVRSRLLKEKLLDKMGIQKLDGETFLQTYLRHIAELNGLPATTPVHPDIAELVFGESAVARTMWFLA